MRHGIWVVGIPVHTDRKIGAAHRLWAATHGLTASPQAAGELVQDGQTLPRQIGCGTFGRGGRLLKTMLPISVSDVARDPDLLHATHMPLPRTCGIKLHIERHGRHPTAFIQ